MKGRKTKLAVLVGLILVLIIVSGAVYMKTQRDAEAEARFDRIGTFQPVRAPGKSFTPGFKK